MTPLLHHRTLRPGLALAALAAVVTLAVSPAFADRSGAISAFDDRADDLSQDGWEVIGSQNVGWYAFSAVQNTPVEKAFHLEDNRRYTFVAGSDGGARDVDIVLKDPSGREVVQDIGADATPQVACTTRTDGTYRLRITLTRGNRLVWLYAGAFHDADVTDPNRGDDAHHDDGHHDDQGSGLRAVRVNIPDTRTPDEDRHGLPLPRRRDGDRHDGRRDRYAVLSASATDSDMTEELATFERNTVGQFEFNMRGAAAGADTLYPSVEFWLGDHGLALFQHDEHWELAEVDESGYDVHTMPRGFHVDEEEWVMMQVRVYRDEAVMYVDGDEFGRLPLHVDRPEFKVRVVAYTVHLREADDPDIGRGHGDRGDSRDVVTLDAARGQTRVSARLTRLDARETFTYRFRPDERRRGFSITSIEFVAGSHTLCLVDRGSSWSLQRYASSRVRRTLHWPSDLEIRDGWNEIEIERTNSEVRFSINGVLCMSRTQGRSGSLDVYIRARSYLVSIGPGPGR